jgi:glycosyltransferase involved in cell wall biosynthesis
MAKLKYPDSRLLISEHGIYTREREEEVIKADWINGIYKNLWIEQFRKMSMFAYQTADKITSLYEHARALQIELGCPPEKTIVTPNGINPSVYANIPQKDKDDPFINIGAVLRVTPIKDVKTLIMAFGYAKAKNPDLKLWIMGPTDEDEEYANECFHLVSDMEISDVVFTGRIQVKEYIGKMDFTMLTSISEGQPLTILESYAAHKPVIATDVGNCRGLIFGEDDDYGPGGILTHIMNVEEITQAILTLAERPKLREEYGNNGYKRLMKKYTIKTMKHTYAKIYSDLLKQN